MYDELVKRLQDYAAGTMRDDDAEIALDAINAIEKLEHKVFILEGDREGLLAQIPRWIPVTEALPEDECPVLVTYLGFHDHKPRANMLAYIDRDLGWCWWDDDIPGGVPCSVEITHWLPLPEPPKEET